MSSRLRSPDATTAVGRRSQTPLPSASQTTSRVCFRVAIRAAAVVGRTRPSARPTPVWDTNTQSGGLRRAFNWLTDAINTERTEYRHP